MVLDVQNIEKKVFPTGPNGAKGTAPEYLLKTLPDSLDLVNEWLAEHSPVIPIVEESAWLLGFVLAVHRDMPEHASGNLLNPTLINVSRLRYLMLGLV